MFLEDPQNNEVYKTFLSSKDILDILVTRFGEEPFTARQIERMVNADGSWNEMKSRRVNGKMVEGRHLWVMLEGHLATFNVNIRDQYLKHLKTLVMKNIEYVRKSVTNESDKTRSRLLNKMTNTLREKNKCTTLFVSPKSNAGENIEERDKDVDLTLLENLKGCNGTTQDIINHLERKLQDTRLVVLDYAGLSTNAGDLRHFFGKYEQIKELIVDCGTRYDVITQHQLCTL